MVGLCGAEEEPLLFAEIASWEEAIDWLLVDDDRGTLLAGLSAHDVSVGDRSLGSTDRT